MRYRFGAFDLDDSTFELSFRGERLRVQRRTLETIIFLVQNRHRLVTRDDLHAGPWRDSTVSEAAVSQAIKEARKVLGRDGPGCQAITTIRGKGFRFDLDVEVVALPPSKATPILLRDGSGFGLRLCEVSPDCAFALLHEAQEARERGVDVVFLFAVARSQRSIEARENSCVEVGEEAPCDVVSPDHAPVVRSRNGR